MDIRQPVKMKKFLKENQGILFGYVDKEFVQMKNDGKKILISPKNLLTEKQTIVYKIAKELGYFDFPRKINLSPLAKKMGLCPSTMSIHLQKIIRSLVNKVKIGEGA